MIIAQEAAARCSTCATSRPTTCASCSRSRRTPIPQLVMAYLYKHTPLADERPRQPDLPGADRQPGDRGAGAARPGGDAARTSSTSAWTVVTRRLEFELAELQRRIHILEGFENDLRRARRDDPHHPQDGRQGRRGREADRSASSSTTSRSTRSSSSSSTSWPSSRSWSSTRSSTRSARRGQAHRGAPQSDKRKLDAGRAQRAARARGAASRTSAAPRSAAAAATSASSTPRTSSSTRTPP